MAEHIQRAAAERVRSDRVSLVEALELTRQQIAALLPEGRATPQHHFHILLNDRGEPLGHYWLFVGRSPAASLYDLFVVEQHRRQGVGRAALTHIERVATEHGCNCVWLNVLGHNDAARALYTNAGYQVGAVHMVKFMEPVG